jgi:LPXTG-motif cell wall-anchored protein
VSRGRLWLIALVAALLVAAVVMLLLKWNSDPAPGQIGEKGNVIYTSVALLLLLVLAGLSARRRKGKGDGDDG